MHCKPGAGSIPDFSIKNSEYDQEIPQSSQTADNPVALRGRAA